MQNVPQNLHRIQGVNHLNRVLAYAPMIEEDGEATVHLTPEDWQVVYDTLFHMETPKDELPDAIQEFESVNDGRSIRLTTSDLVIDLEPI